MAFEKAQLIADRFEKKFLNFSIKKLGHKIGKTFDADCFVETSASFTRKVAMHPVSTGSNGVVRTDCVTKDPMTLTITGYVSAFPVKYSILYKTPSLRDRVLNLRDELIYMWNDTSATTIVTIVDGVFGYDNMVLRDLLLPRTSELGDSLKFTATFQQVELFKKEFVDIEEISQQGDSQSQYADKKEAGTVAAEEVDQSAAHWIVSGAAKGIKGVFQ